MQTQEEIEFKQDHPVLAAGATAVGTCMGFVKRNRTTILAVAAGAILYTAVNAKHQNRHAEDSREDDV